VRRPLRAVLLVGVVLLGGCALRAPRPRPVRPASVEELLAVLAERRLAITTLRARARLRAGLRGVWMHETLLVSRPDSVRIDVLSPFGLALALGARGALLWAFPAGEATRYEGSATPANLTRFLGAPISVPDIVDVLLGLPPARAPAGRPTAAPTREGEHRLTVPLADGVQTIWFAGDTLAVLRAEEERGGAVAVRVGFGDYRDGFPHALDIGVPASGAEATLTYDAVEPNAPVDPVLFAPPTASRVLPLEAAPG
jgi:hypothetical protein